MLRDIYIYGQVFQEVLYLFVFMLLHLGWNTFISQRLISLALLCLLINLLYFLFPVTDVRALFFNLVN